MKCFVTGADGFIGGYLVELLLARGDEVTALAYAPSEVLDGLADRCRVVRGDVLDRGRMQELIRGQGSDAVYHLAAQSYPGVSWDQPALTYRVNVMGTVEVLESVRASAPESVVLLACSSSEYAPRADGGRIPEDGAMRPASPYAVSKLATDHLGRLYHERYGLRVVRVRPFFLVGPRKTGDVSSDFARGIVAIERGRREDLPVGELSVVRDLLDVRDGVEAFRLLVEKGTAGEVYNVCSGQGYVLRDVLDMFKELARAEVRERTDPDRLRPIEEMVKTGDPSKLEALGWAPKRDIRRTLEDILAYWRSRAAEGVATERS